MLISYIFTHVSISPRVCWWTE